MPSRQIRINEPPPAPPCQGDLCVSRKRIKTRFFTAFSMTGNAGLSSLRSRRRRRRDIVPKPSCPAGVISGYAKLALSGGELFLAAREHSERLSPIARHASGPASGVWGCGRPGLRLDATLLTALARHESFQDLPCLFWRWTSWPR